VHLQRASEEIENPKFLNALVSVERSLDLAVLDDGRVGDLDEEESVLAPGGGIVPPGDEVMKVFRVR
jgi:hypothetical protein